MREQPGCQTAKNFHNNFKTWASESFPTGVSEESWQEIMVADSLHPYHTPVSAITIPTTPGQSTTDDDQMVQENPSEEILADFSGPSYTF